MRVVYSEHFQAELCCITGRYTAEGRELGRSFVQTVESICVEIAADPLRWRIFDGRVRRCLVPRFPYIIYYLVEDGLIYFGAMLHSARHPETFHASFADL